MTSKERAIIDRTYTQYRKAALYYEVRGDDVQANIMQQSATAIHELASELRAWVTVPSMDTIQEWREEFKHGDMV